MTDQEREMLRLYVEGGLSLREVGERMGVHHDVVAYVVRREGEDVRPPGGVGYTDRELEDYIRRRSEDLGRPVRAVDIHEDPDGPACSTIDRYLGDGRETVSEIIARVLGVEPWSVHHGRLPRPEILERRERNGKGGGVTRRPA